MKLASSVTHCPSLVHISSDGAAGSSAPHDASEQRERCSTSTASAVALHSVKNSSVRTRVS